MHVVLVLGRLTQENHSEFEASLDCILRFYLMKNKTRRRKKKMKKKKKGKEKRRKRKKRRKQRSYLHYFED